MNGRISGVLLVGLVAVIAFSVVGCGGGEDTADAGVTLTKVEFIKQGDAICEETLKRNEKQINELAEKNDFTFGSASQAQLEEVVTKAFIPSVNQQTEELGALGSPEGDEEQVEEIVVSLEGVADEMETDPLDAFKGNPLEKPGRLAKAYGFKVCGQE